jgi:glycosyltransferase involved in cell wall biosynthesis
MSIKRYEIMKILQIIDSLTSGGAEKLIADISLEIAKSNNYSVDILLLSDKNNVYQEELIINKVNIKVIPLRSIRNPFNILYITYFLIQNNYDVVHVHLFPATYWVSLAFRLLKRNKPKVIMTEHSTYNKRRSVKQFKVIEKFIYNNFDYIISISEETQNNILKWLEPKNIDLGKFKVVNNGIDIKKFANASKYSISEFNKKNISCQVFICMIGRFTDSKDHETLINAMRSLPDYIGLVLVGEGPKLDYIKNIVTQYGLDNRILFLGFRKDVNRIIKSMDVIVHSANWEGFGLAVVEAMAAGKPVIASNVDGLRNIVEDAGILFQKGNSSELRDAILNLINNEEMYIRISELCKLRAKKYSIQKTSLEYLSIYESMIGGEK